MPTLSRRLLLEDSLWVGDMFTSAGAHDGPASTMIPLLLSGHAARVVHEGRDLLIKPRDPRFADATLAAALPPATSPAVARARHATKMLDNQVRKNKPVSEFEAEIRRSRLSHRYEMRRPVTPGFKWAQKDMGLYILDDRIFGCTVALHHRFDLAGVNPRMYGPFFRDFGADVGASIWVHTLLSGSAEAITVAQRLDVPDRIIDVDVYAHRYLNRRYDPHLTVDQKLLILLVESEVNTAATLIPSLSAGHPEAAFRARFVSLWHAVSSLKKILDTVPTATAPGTARMRELVNSPLARTFTDNPSMLQLRHRCVHYEIPVKTQITLATTPMFGIIESLTGFTMATLSPLVEKLGVELSDHLLTWRESSQV